MTAYYSENEPVAAEVIRCQIKDGVIAPYMVDDRSIKDVQADDLKGFDQCHFFAGAGTWSLAARLAGWRDTDRLWTASCPCQPFSAAGKGHGTNDPRHLWPDLFRLIRATCDAGFGPSVLVGEQVAGKAGYAWFDGVRADLAREGFSARTIDFPALAVNAPHERNRQYWAAISSGGDGFSPRLEGHVGDGVDRASALERANSGSKSRRSVFRSEESNSSDQQWAHNQSRGSNGGFGHNHWFVCHDGKARRTKPGLRLLVDGMAGRVPAWRLVGNSIVVPAAVEVLTALREVITLNP